MGIFLITLIILITITIWPKTAFFLFPIASVCLPLLPQFLPPRGLFIEEIIIVCIIFSFITKQRRLFIGKKIKLLTSLFILLILSEAITLFIVLLRWGITVRDILELFRTLKYAIILNIAGIADNKEKRMAVDGLFMSVLLADAVGLLQYFNPDGLGEILINIYGKENTIRFLDQIQRQSGTWRIPGTLANPNDFAVILCIMVFSLYVNRNEFSLPKSKHLSGIIFYVVLAITIIVIIMTQSRTGFFAIIIGFMIMSTNKVVTEKRRVTRYIISTSIVLFILIAFTSITFTNARLFDLENSRQSFEYRQWVWRGALSTSLSESPFFGIGPEKLTEVSKFEDLDSDYVMFLKRWGLCGALIYSVMLSVIGYFGLTLLFGSKVHCEKTKGGAIIVLVAIVLTAGLTNTVWFNNRIADLFFFIIGILLSSENKRLTVFEKSLMPK